MSPVSAATPLDQQLSQLTALFAKGINHKSQELYQLSDERPEDDFYVHMIASLFRSIDGLLSMDKVVLEDALRLLHKAAAGSNKYRKKVSWFFRTEYNSYSDLEAHAELAHADVMMFTAIVYILHEDMSLMSFINAALNVKSSYASYQTCYAIVNNKNNWVSEKAQMHLESGARMAIGAFDLMISFIPNKFAKLLEFVGFSGDREFGLHELKMSESLSEGSRWPVVAMILGGYNLFLEVAYGLAEPDLKLVSDIAHQMELKFPDSGYFKSTRGIYRATIGDFDEGLRLFQESNDSDAVTEFKYANHLFMSLIYVLQSKWSEALTHAQQLEGCKWSPASFTYLRAVLLNMVMCERKQPELQPLIHDLLTKVPSLKKTLGGKKALHEKFVLGRSKAFLNNEQDLDLASFEFTYISNYSNWIAGRNEDIDKIMATVDKKLQSVDPSCPKYHDKLAYLTFIQGVLFRLKGRDCEAKKRFEQVILMEDRIREDFHSPALAAYELGMYYRKIRDYSAAKSWLKRAASSYKDHFAEPLISFRAELALQSVKAMKKATKSSSSSTGGLCVRDLATRG